MLLHSDWCCRSNWMSHPVLVYVPGHWGVIQILYSPHIPGIWQGCHCVINCNLILILLLWRFVPLPYVLGCCGLTWVGHTKVTACLFQQELRERVLRGKYRIPFYMSTDCENLLKKFLVLNPQKRLSLEVCVFLLYDNILDIWSIWVLISVICATQKKISYNSVDNISQQVPFQ